MHQGELPIDTALVQRLLAAQFPQWAALPLAPVPSAGTDNALFRLGAELVVRLPRIGWAVGQVVKEHTWLPRLAPHLPLAIPEPIALGEPGESYPWHWAVHRWIEGKNVAETDTITLPLTAFLLALQACPTTNGPSAGEQNFGRGIPLAERDHPTRRALAELEAGGWPETRAATAAWERACAVPVWDRAPVWVHGDLQSGNLLAREGALAAVIDFGGLGVGDPAVELIVAWNLLSAGERGRFRQALGVDAATWERGKGWALSVALIALPYYETRSPVIAAASRRTISAVLAAREE